MHANFVQTILKMKLKPGYSQVFHFEFSLQYTKYEKLN
jgi:hypothetical protein